MHKTNIFTSRKRTILQHTKVPMTVTSQHFSKVINLVLKQIGFEYALVKSLVKTLIACVQIWTFFWSVFFRIQFEYGKKGARKTMNLDIFHAVPVY